MTFRIQDIIVEISDDTTKLSKAQERGNKSIKGDAVRTEGCQQTPETGPLQYRTGRPEA